MADNKKYYYLKLKDNFFDSDEMIVLESMPDGYIYSNILLKLYLRSLKYEGRLMFNERIPFNSTMLSQVTRHSIGDVEKAIQVFRDLELIEVLDNGAIYMLDIQNFIGKSSTEADRKRDYRQQIKKEKDSLLLNDVTNVTTNVRTNVPKKGNKCPDKSTPEIEIELEKELEIEKEDSKPSRKYSDEHLRLAEKLKNNLIKDFPSEMKKVKIEKWADIFRLMEERDKQSIEAVDYVLDWLPTNQFWFGNIRSASKFRTQFEKLKFEIKQEKERSKQPKTHYRQQPVRQESKPEWLDKPREDEKVSAEEQAELDRQIAELFNKGGN
ncbi:phage replisome organizer N-terminal domain-containing protein [Enterococcus faecalis]|uniref:phage replisome organizer N-terminal domain-containing protein n=1 Tax=Enterococcus faecalis TaxID=1351 RepID=UPI0034CD8B25